MTSISQITDTAQTVREPQISTQQWIELATVVSILAVGVLFSEAALIGVAISAVDYTINWVYIYYASRAIVGDHSPPAINHFVHPLKSCLYKPILEESIYRLAIPTILKTYFTAMGITHASALAICISSSIFGMAHLKDYPNDPLKTAERVGLVVLGGFFYSILTETISPITPFAAHIFYNSAATAHEYILTDLV